MPYSEGIGMSSLLFGHLTTGSSDQQYRSGFSVFREKEITQYIDICQSIIMHLEHGSYRIVKTLVVQNQINEKTSVNRVELQVIDNHVSILQAFKSIRLDLTDKIVRIYDFRKNSYTPIHAQNKIPLSWISGNGCDLVLVKLGTMLQSITSHSGSASHKNEKLSESSTAKKERSKERVIFEVIQIVKKWRELHVNKNSLKKMSLMQAAKILGMPKKSLDDYFYQLRLGQKYGFDFQTHLFDRMGVLRTYLKNLKGHTDIDKYQKHPKNLRIMDKFDDLSELFFNGSCNYPQARHQMQLQVIEQDAISQKKLQEELEASKMNDFRSEFQYLLDEKDPFLVGDFNFKKKMMQVDQDQIFH